MQYMHFMPYILYMCDVYNVFLQKKITVIQYYLQNNCDIQNDRQIGK